MADVKTFKNVSQGPVSFRENGYDINPRTNKPFGVTVVDVGGLFSLASEVADILVKQEIGAGTVEEVKPDGSPLVDAPVATPVATPAAKATKAPAAAVDAGTAAPGA
jgi:hypothetical protein